MIEKIIERLKKDMYWDIDDSFSKGYNSALNNAIQIVREIGDRFGKETNVLSNGWIPCSERLPDTNDAVNITWVNRKPMPYYRDVKDKPFTATGHYHNGKWYWYSCVCKDYLDEYGNSDMDEIDKDIEVIAWQPLPAPYQEGEYHGNRYRSI